jgi:hypothetical protein
LIFGKLLWALGQQDINKPGVVGSNNGFNAIFLMDIKEIIGLALKVAGNNLAYHPQT